MHRIVDAAVTVLAAVVLLALIAYPAFARTKDDHVLVVADPIVLLTIKDVGECTGFVANVFGQKNIITAGHCVADALKAGAPITAKDSIGREFATELVYLDLDHDIAILGAADTDLVKVSAAALGCNDEVRVGDPVKITGYPLDYGKVTTVGSVAAQSSPWQVWPDVYRLNIFAGPGNSGSPVFDSLSGDVIGILVGGNPQWPGMSMAVPVSEVCRPKVA